MATLDNIVTLLPRQFDVAQDEDFLEIVREDADPFDSSQVIVTEDPDQDGFLIAMFYAHGFDLMNEDASETSNSAGEILCFIVKHLG